MLDVAYIEDILKGEVNIMRLTLDITEAAYKAIKREVFVSGMIGGMTARDQFRVKLFEAWENDEIPDISLKSEREGE